MPNIQAFTKELRKCKDLFYVDKATKSTYLRANANGFMALCKKHGFNYSTAISTLQKEQFLTNDQELIGFGFRFYKTNGSIN